MSVRKIAIAASVAFVSITPLASAKTHLTTCERAWNVRLSVVRHQGSRAPGRNICRFGLATSNGVKPAPYYLKIRYLHALQRLAAPAPRYLVRIAVAPAQPPAGTLTASVQAGSFASCVAQRESGGSLTATNGSHWGKYQFDDQTWQAATGLGGHASQYSEATQDRAFSTWYPGHPSAWAQTAPGC